MLSEVYGLTMHYSAECIQIYNVAAFNRGVDWKLILAGRA